MRRTFQIVTDALMTITLFLLMAFQVTGTQVHEYIGIVMAVLIIAHNVLNHRWYKRLFKGRYTSVRVWITGMNIALMASLVMQMVSGIILSRYALSFLPSWGREAIARRIHLACAQWSYLLTGLHLGNHWLMVMRGKQWSSWVKALGYILAICGLVVLMQTDVAGYMFMRQTFFIYADSEPVVYTFLKLVCLFALYVFSGSRMMKFLTRMNRQRTI